VTSIAEPFMGPPLSECNVRIWGCTSWYALHETAFST
jgi:hypothetical protein